jgi:hypothetical protein
MVLANRANRPQPYHGTRQEGTDFATPRHGILYVPPYSDTGPVSSLSHNPAKFCSNGDESFGLLGACAGELFLFRVGLVLLTDCAFDAP